MSLRLHSFASSNEFSEYAPKVLVLLYLDLQETVRFEFLDLVACADFDRFLVFESASFFLFLVPPAVSLDFLLFRLFSDFDL